MRRTFQLTLTVVATIALAVACSGDDDGDSGGAGGGGGGGGFDSGLDGDATLASLTDDQQIAACEAALTYAAGQIDADNAKKAGCLFAGLMAGAMGGGTCDDAYAACMSADAPADGGGEDEEACAAQDLSACTDATVADREACNTDTFAMQSEMINQMASETCASLAAAAESDEAGAPAEPPASCTALWEKCEVLNPEQDGPGTPPGGEEGEGEGGEGEGEGEGEGS